MGSVRSTIDLVITGSTRGLGAAAAEARAMAERVEAAEDRVSAARTRSAAAEDRVRVVEQQLSSARAQQEAALSRIGVAETNLAQARAASLGSTTRLSQAQADLDAVRTNSASTAEQISAAEERVTRTRQEADTAAARLQASEAQLASARANAQRSSAQVAAAEAAINRARSDAIRASEDLARRENDLNIIRRRGNNDINQQRTGLLGVFDAVGRLADAFTGADGASTSFLSKMAALHSVFSSIGGPIVQAVVGILQIIAVLATVGEVVGLVGGLIGQALGGIPVLRLAVGAAAGTVMLGMDGIKKAAEAAAPAFDKLKTAISDEFAVGLTPVFQQLGKDLPQLTENFRDIAAAISDIAARLVGVISSVPGMQRLQLVLAGTADFVKALGPGLATFADGLIRIGAAAAPAMQRLGEAFSAVFNQLGGIFARLAADGTIETLIKGLASTIQGLGNVLGPVIEALLRMGAALGTTLGDSLTGIGNIIQTTIPFWQELARVAGELLLSAVQQLGPPIERLLQSLLPGATNGLDGFAKIIETQVLPAIGHFIDWLRTDGGPAIERFWLGATLNALSFASSMAGALSSVLNVLARFFATLALIPGPMQDSFAKAAAATQGFANNVDGLKAGIDGLKDKTVQVLANVPDTPKVVDMKNQIALTNSKKVDITASVPNTPQVVDMKNQIALTNSKKVDITGRVPDTPKIVDMHQNIALVKDKNVAVTAKVDGTSAVQELVGWIGQVKDKVVSVVTHVATVLGFRKGGQVPPNSTILVGEEGPELLQIGSRGGFVTPAGPTAQILSAGGGRRNAQPGSSDPAAGSDQPITVNVMLSQEQIAGIAQVEIVRQNRATKRTVLAGSGVTF